MASIEKGTNVAPSDAQAASPDDSASTATSSGSRTFVTQPLSPEQVAEALGATVISHEENDSPGTPQSASPSTPVAKPAARTGPSACADCGGDLTGELSDPVKRDYLRLSKAKHKRYLCSNCHDKASGK